MRNIYQHPKYNPQTIDFDFSLLKLEEEIEFNDKMRSIELPKFNDTVEDNTVCLVTGWGDTKSLFASSKSLRGVEVPIYNFNDCKQLYKSHGGITERMLCAGFQKGKRDACQGMLTY